MSLDRSLKSANSLVRHRNVLSRAERLEKLAEQEKWNDSKSVFGLPKVAHRKMTLAKVKEEAPAEGAAAAPGAAPAAGAAAPAAGAKGAAPAAKGTAPAAGAKGAAPAAKAAAPAAKKK
ncbi:MAG TPA: small basic protein [Tepidisphaeraceae bacterium]|jgi:small basic protein (TIGR04137 family)|nr:small basic protein [Tepidisphaeraceae bacterium]